MNDDQNEPIAWYRPLAGNPKMVLLLAGALVVIGFMRGWGFLTWDIRTSGDLLFAIIAWVVPFVFIARVGVQTELLPDAVRVLRFGRVKKQFPLSTFRGVRFVAGSRFLRFDGGSVLVDSVGAEGFIRTVKEQARDSGATVAPTIDRTSTDEAFFDFGHLRCDDRLCVGCDSAPTVFAEFQARRGYDLVFHKHIFFVKFKMPLCSSCDRRRRILFWGQWVAVIALFIGPLALAPAYLGVLKSPASNYVWPVPALVAFVFVANFGRRVADWFGAGVRVGWLNRERSGASIRFAKVERLDSILNVSARQIAPRASG